MKYVIAAVVVWFLAVLGVSAMPYVKVLGVTPDLVLIFAACWAVVRGQDQALIVVPIAGLMHDLLTSDPVGASLLGFIPIVLLAAAARMQAIDTDFISAVAVVAAGTLCYEVIHLTILAAVGQSVDADYAVLHVIIPAAVVNALFSPIVYLPVRWLSPEQAAVMTSSRRLTSPL